jgi:hypothetical protein
MEEKRTEDALWEDYMLVRSINGTDRTPVTISDDENDDADDENDTEEEGNAENE